jgi:methylglyoxal/glyoxal reductase
LQEGFQMISKIGFGTYRLGPDEAQEIVYAAIKQGYRSIDTAAVYKNERQVGLAINQAIKEKLVDRKDIFLTTKIAPKDAGYENSLVAIRKSLELLDCGYIDLLLLHWPGTQKRKPSDPRNKENRLGSIVAMNEIRLKGLVAHIGVSNFNINHFDGIPLDIPIFANQIELHPLLWNTKTKDLVKFCRSRGILIEAYSCLGEGKLLDSSKYSELGSISNDLNCAVAQVLIAWANQKDFIVMPKSSNVARMKENLKSVLLSDNQIAILDDFPTVYGSKKFCWDPELIA